VKIKRYNPNGFVDGIGIIELDHTFMEEIDSGKWVKYEDYISYVRDLMDRIEQIGNQIYDDLYYPEDDEPDNLLKK
jgi:hypothetical protein